MIAFFKQLIYNIINCFNFFDYAYTKDIKIDDVI